MCVAPILQQQGFTEAATSAPLQTIFFVVVLGAAMYTIYRCAILLFFGHLRAAERLKAFDKVLSFLLIKVRRSNTAALGLAE